MIGTSNGRVSYYFVLTPQAVLQLYRKDSPYSPIPPTEAQKLSAITAGDKKLLTDYKLGPTGVHNAKELIERLSASELPLAPSAWDFQRGKSWSIDTTSKFALHLSMTRLVSARGSSEHFSLHLKSAPAATHAERPFFVRDSQVIFFGESKLMYREVPQPLASLLSNLKRAAMLPFGRASASTPVQVAIDGAWLGQLHVLTKQLRESSELTLDPALEKIKIAKPPKMVLAALHDVDPTIGERFILSPLLDWGHTQEDISETFYMSRAGGKQHFERRADKSHYLKEEDGGLYLTLVDHDLAKNFYTLLSAHGKALGMNAQLQCRIAGEARIKAYMKESWPTVLAFAAAHGIEVRMNQSTLGEEQLSFSADLAVALEPNDKSSIDGQLALSLDATFRIGEHIVTFEELRAFADSASSHLTLRTGESVKIENRDELVRLVRMLRSFESVEGRFRGKLHNAGELRYVMTGSTHYNARQSESVKQLMTQVESGKPVKPVVIDPSLEGTLRPYQKEGIDWLGFLRDYHFGGILADDMGLGKTLQTLAFLATTRKDDRPHIVVCPKTLVSNWAYEAEKFVPGLRVHAIDGTAAERKKAHKAAEGADIIITSYSVLLADAAIFNAPEKRYNYVVLDEAQFIKNHASKTAQLVKKLTSDHRLALTGTPLENNIVELWSIMDFLMPGFLGDHAVFMERYGKPVANGESEPLEHLRRKVSVFMLRRTKKEVLGELPPKIEQHAPIALTADQKVLYAATLSQARAEIEESVASRGWGKSQIHILAALTKLRQICNHPALVLPEDDPMRAEATSGKMELALELIEEALAANTKESKEPHKVLVFSQFVGMLELMSLALKERNIKHVTLTGKTQKRGEVVKEFTDDTETCVFLISTRAGGTGLNLTSADTVIVVDPWWNPSVERQAVDRAHRIGQKRTVNVYRLITTGTIEEKIQSLQKKKQGLFDALIEESKTEFGKLTWEDVKELFAD